MKRLMMTAAALGLLPALTTDCLEPSRRGKLSEPLAASRGKTASLTLTGASLLGTV